MGLSSQLELAQEIVRIAALPPTERQQSLLRDALSRAQALGARVDEHERSIVVHLRHASGSFAVFINVLPRPPEEARDAGGDPDVSPEEIVELVNDGVLTREIDQAVRWDPEVTV